MAVPDFERIEGKYEILDKLSEGGMGAVYRVRHRLLDELRVVKVIRPQLEGDAKLRDRFLREARSAVRLRHPNIATLHDFTIDDEGVAFMVMEFINGEDLKRVVARHERLPIGLGLEVGVQTLRALQYLHTQNFIHRDISPDNLMLCRDPEERLLVKLIDLGVAKSLEGSEELTRDGMFIGKFKYGAPEQFGGAGLEVDQRTDLYSLGVALYEVLTGVHPIPGDNEREIVGGHLFHPPRGFDETDADGRLPEALRSSLLRAMEKTPDDRFQTAAEFGQTLRDIQQDWEDQGEDSFIDLQTTEIGGDGGSADLSTQRRLDYQFAPDVTPPPVAGVRVVSRAGDDDVTVATAAPAFGPGSGPTRIVLATIFVALVGLIAYLVLREPAELAESAEPSVEDSLESRAALEVVAPAAEDLSDRSIDLPAEDPPVTTVEPAAPAAEPTRPVPRAPAQPSAAELRAGTLVSEARAFYRQGKDRETLERLRAAFALAPSDEAGLRLLGELARSAESKAARARRGAETAAVPGRAVAELSRAIGAQGSAAEHLAAGRLERAIEGFWSSTELFAEAGRAAEEAVLRETAAAAQEEADRRAVAERAAQTERERQSRAQVPPPTPRAPVDEVPAILELIDAFARAHGALDIGAVRALWPALRGGRLRALTDSFEGAREIEMKISECVVQATGTTAVARCALTQSYRPKRGTRQSIEREVTLQLAKVSDRWQIEDYT